MVKYVYIVNCSIIIAGIASTVGGGVYIVVGQTAKSEAGPSVIASVVIAGMVALLSGL